MLAATEGQIPASNVEELLNDLKPIGGTKFEAKRPWQDPYSHGYRAKKLQDPVEGHTRLWA